MTETAKEYLNKIREIDNEINDKQAELDDLREMSTALGSPSLGDRVQTSPDFDKIGGIVAKIADMQKEINDMIDQYIDQKDEARKLIDRLENQKERMVLRRRYLRNMKWDDIYADMEYSKKQTHRIHGSALENLNQMAR